VQVLNPSTGAIERELTAKNILIAVGGGPKRLGIPGGDLTITSDEALSLPEQPKKIAVIGAGYIAVEFANIFAGFGSDVHLFYRKPLPLTSMSPLLLVCSPHCLVQMHSQCFQCTQYQVFARDLNGKNSAKSLKTTQMKPKY
jgi:hypothetical protein